MLADVLLWKSLAAYEELCWERNGTSVSILQRHNRMPLIDKGFHNALRSDGYRDRCVPSVMYSDSV